LSRAFSALFVGLIRLSSAFYLQPSVTGATNDYFILFSMLLGASKEAGKIFGERCF
jgi:hypothetical protein